MQIWHGWSRSSGRALCPPSHRSISACWPLRPNLHSERLDMVCLVDHQQDNASITSVCNAIDSFHTIIPGLDRCQRLRLSLNQLGKLQEQVSSLGRRQATPGRVLESLPCCFDGDINVFRPRSLYGRNFLLVTGWYGLGQVRLKTTQLLRLVVSRWIDGSDLLSRFGCDELVANK